MYHAYCLMLIFWAGFGDKMVVADTTVNLAPKGLEPVGNGWIYLGCAPSGEILHP